MSWRILAVELLEELEVTKVVIRIRKLKKNTNEKEQTTIYKTLHRKLMIVQRESHLVMDLIVFLVSYICKANDKKR
jgi:hypothetical protein